MNIYLQRNIIFTIYILIYIQLKNVKPLTIWILYLLLLHSLITYKNYLKKTENKKSKKNMSNISK